MKSQSRLIIDLSAIKQNYLKLQDFVGAACAVAGVVKADAYGLGVAHIVPALEEAGCTLFFTATPREAMDVRSFTTQKIAVLNPILDEETASGLAAAKIMPVLNTIADIEVWNSFCRAVGRKFPAFLQLDTGMRRVGLSLHDAQYLSQNTSLLEAFDVYAIMSHFASADDTSSPKSRNQHKSFEDMLALLPQDIVKGAKKCLSNSAGTALDKSYHYDIVRPGKSVFGLQAIENFENAPVFKSPITLEARILQIIDVQKGDTIGYNETWTADKDMRIATVSMGYADGIRRHLSSKGHFIYHGNALPIRGRVSMDMTMVQIDQCETAVPKRGDWVQFLCAQQTPDDIAKIIGTNGYEVLTGLGKRAERLYIETKGNIIQTPFLDNDVKANTLLGAA